MSTVAYAQLWIFFLLYLGVFVACVAALVDLLRRPAEAFPRAGKRTKGFWGAILGVATAVSFVAIPPPVGIGQLGFLAIIGVVAAIVYFVDVRPALGPIRRRRPPSSGGW
ncbi:DUF2516 family protein [Actinotalea sp. M2MS4P-6]|uniref:DUF2516 family protein n=1 Tax=Actinotalea sp. M2MS4P-6 TaxID=2983762 RepID=UPI0021E4F07A|nr:DUF2516 family protein [Actinotalea sp. M2MS4P-6]MCV2393195.1 DUF2516 family protein [Actinotalea sp. M2MS4P-6]